MIGFGQRTLARWLSGVLLTLLAGVLSAPSAAQAGCDYPVPVWRGEAISVDFAHNMPAHSAIPSGHVPLKPKAPCNGPTCSHRPASAPMTIPSPPSVQVDSWALLDPRLLLPASPPGICLDADEVLPLARYGQDIFHPPRFTSLD